MAEKANASGFWDRLIRFLVEAIEMAESLVGPGEGDEKKKRALGLVEKWYRNSGIRIPYLPGPIERWVVKRIAAGMIDSLVEILKPRVASTRRQGFTPLATGVSSHPGLEAGKAPVGAKQE